MKIEKRTDTKANIDFEDVFEKFLPGCIVEDENGYLYVVTNRETLLCLDNGYLYDDCTVKFKEVTDQYVLKEV